MDRYGRPVSCADRFYQSANAQNAHRPFHVVGQDVQRHFRTDVLERLHLEASIPLRVPKTISVLMT
jgi:hypothetical protein